jgi:type IV secretory pathway TraG/TraD family ATPase VirD4
MNAPRQHPVHPGGHAGGYPLTPWLLLGTMAAAVALSWLAWAAGALVAWLTGAEPGPGYGEQFIAGLLRGQWHHLWPGVEPVHVLAVHIGLLLLALAPAAGAWVWWRRRRPRAGDPLPSLAHAHDVADLCPRRVAARAIRLRAGLAGATARRLPARDIGVPLGRLVAARGRRPILHASWEDVLLAIMAPRAGKTTALAVPPILQAPGPVVATSNKADLWAATTGARAAVGEVWLFDPQHITRSRQTFWWNPLATVTSLEEASRLADHFVQEIRTPGIGDVFWPLAASDLLTCLFLAAAHSGGTLADVQAWLSDPTSREPVTLLRAAGFPQAARALLGRQNGAPETRDGVYETARTAARCLADPAITTWVTPPAANLPALDVNGFPTTSHTLYLLSKEGAGAAAPLVAALTDQVFRAAVNHAEAAGGRLDPPMLAVLDEAANICKITDLPQLYSHLGSRGIIPITIIQNYAQGAGVWGDRGMAALWSAATVKLVGAGLDDARHTDDISRLIGEHDVAVASLSRDAAGYTNWSTSVQRRRIMEPGQVRALPRGQALLLATGTSPALIELQPWYTGTRAAQTAAELATAHQQLTHHARTHLNHHHPTGS